jgi:hypothetical protein
MISSSEVGAGYKKKTNKKKNKNEIKGSAGEGKLRFS